MRRISLSALLVFAFPSLAAITGTVMNTDGQPLQGARVSIHAFESDEGRRARLISENPERPPLARVETDAKGNFSLESPKEPVVTLAVEVRGHVPVAQMVERDEAVGAIALRPAEMRRGSIRSGGKQVAGAVVAISYDAAEYLVRTDEQGRFEAPQSNAFSGIQVWHPQFAVAPGSYPQITGRSMPSLDLTLQPKVKLEGKVVAADGSPAAGAVVRADSWPVAVAGDDGSFTAMVSPGWKMLTADTSQASGAEVRGKDAPTIRLTPNTNVSGRITDSGTGRGIVGAVVRITPARPNQNIAAQSVQTDARGDFTIAVPAGTLRMGATHPGYGAFTEEIHVVPGRKNSRDAALIPLAVISGTVMDENRRPVAAAVIDSQSEGDPLASIGRMRRLRGAGPAAYSAPDGRFVARIEADDALSIRATKRGLPAAKSEVLKLTPGERKGGVALTIPGGLEVKGKVTDQEGKPVSGVSVSSREVETGTRGMIVRTIMIGGPQREDDSVRTASDGSFTMRLREGTYDVTFQREGYAPKTLRGQTVAASVPLEIETTLDPAVEISGRVVRNGAGVEGVNVAAFGLGSEAATARTGPDGSFTLGGLAPGTMMLNVSKDEDFISERRNTAAPSRDVLIEIPPGGTVRGRVIDKSTRKPVTAFQAGISTSVASGPVVRMTPPQLRDFTSDDGSFVLENVPAGSTVVVASSPGYTGGRMNITVEEGKAVSGVEIELDSGVTLFGRVTGPNGAPLSEAQVEILPSSTAATGLMAFRRVRTDSNGEYRMETLQQGEETVSFSHPKYPVSRKSVVLKGDETRLDAQLSPGLRVTGVVVSDSGSPIADAIVEAFGNGSRGGARTNSGGAFEIDTLAPGRYRFSAAKAGMATATLPDVDISSGAPVRLIMSAGGTIYGRVSGLSPEELTNATVDARGTGGWASASVDARGNYRIEGAPTGAVQVSASVASRLTGARRTSASETVELAAGGNVQADIRFNTELVIRGRVLRNGQPLRGGNISFSSRSFGGSASATVDEQGQYSIAGLTEGEHTVRVMDSQRSSSHTTTYVVRGSAVFDVQYRTSTLRGRVVDASTSAPLENVTVQLRPTGTATSALPDPGGAFMGMQSALTDAAGTFLLEDVAPGTYSATASRDGYGNQTLDVRVTERSAETVEMKLSRNDGAVVKVVDGRDGRPVSGLIVVFDGQGRIVHDSRTATMFAGVGGTELRLPLAPGSYSAMVSAQGLAPRSVALQSPSTVTIPLTPGGTISISSRHAQMRSIRLLDASGLPYPRTSQQRALLPAPSKTTYMATPGTYTIQLLSDQGAVIESRQVVVGEGQTIETEI